jgi:hypothetical protein
VEKIQSGNELYEHFGKMNKINSVSHVYIPGKGIFKILFQEEDSPSILSEVESDHELRQMIEDSRAEYTAGDKTTTEQFLKSLSSDHFAK